MKKLYFLLLILFCGWHASAQYNLTVAADGTGNYTTVQAAINAATAGTATAPFKIFIKNGRYFEKDTVHAAKVYLQLIGESVGGVTIVFNAGASDINPLTGVAYGTSGSATMTINAENFTAMNITFENSTGRKGDGPQALALNVGKDKCAFKNCRFISGQDTIYAGTPGARQYFRGCYIDGNTDFIFGNSIALFDSCVVFGRDRIDGQAGGVITAANTTQAQAFGYAFRDCRIPSGRISTNYSLGRPWQNSGTPNPNPAYNKTVFIRTKMSSSIKAAGWDAWDAGTNTATITYAEYQTRWFNGGLMDISQRVAWSKQLPQVAADTYTVAKMFTNATDSWNPDVAIPGFNTPLQEQIAVANLRVKRAVPQLAISWNVCWPMTGIRYELFRSHDNISFTKVYEETAVTDTAVNFFVNNQFVAGQTQYYYYVKASKAGYLTHISDTVSFNSSLPIAGDFRSVTSGSWADGATWQRYDGTAWIQQSGTATSAYPGSSNDATIRNGHTVTFVGTSYFNSVTIETGATLNSDATGRTVRVSSGIVNNGLFGGPTAATNFITLEFPNPNTNVTLTGSGVYNLYRIRPLTGLVNASLTIDANVTLSGTLGAWYNNASVTTNEKITVTINKGFTVVSTGGSLHNTSVSNTNAGGTYVYNINGTFDMSASTATTYIAPLVPVTSSVTVNVGNGGLLKFGNRFSTTNTAANVLGKVYFNIADSGRVDASMVPNANFDMGANFWDISGSGTFSRAVDSATATTFPIRAAGNVNSSALIVTNDGARDIFTVGLRDTMTNLVTGQVKYVKRQWKITDAVAGGNNATLKFQWTTDHQSTGFDPGLAYVRQYNTVWDSLTSAITGTGTTADPFVATISNRSTVGTFGVFNAKDTVIPPPPPPPARTLIAFPGAEGFGKFAIGGRGGQVVEVTNLDDSGPGSFRQAFQEYPGQPITIVFRVSGIIELLSELKVNRSLITIAGQTAPGDGICLKGNSFIFNGARAASLGGNHGDVIIRYIRSRPGAFLSSGVYGFDMENCHDVIADHCSFSWANEECAALYDTKNTTVQWSIISEGLYDAGHLKGVRSYGGVWGGQYASYHHNLIAHQQSRAIRFNGARAHDTAAVIDYRNNVIYNWGSSDACYGGEVEINNGRSQVNIVNNYYKNGPATATPLKFVTPSYNASLAKGIGEWYVSGNVMYGSQTLSGNNSAGIDLAAIPVANRAGAVSGSGFGVSAAIPAQTANDAYDAVLAVMGAGAILPHRDSIDIRIVKETRIGTYSGTGVKGFGIIDSPSVVGGWPAYNTNNVPTDTDHDGMPDYWELANSLDPNDAADRNAIGQAHYTNLEVYLNQIGLNGTSATVRQLSNSANMLTCYPNPVISSVVVKHPVVKSNASIHLFNINGACVGRYEPAKNVEETVIDMSSLAKGMYLMIFETGNVRMIGKVTKD